MRNLMRIMALCIFTWATLALGLSALAAEDYVLTPALPSAQALGTYSGNLRVELGEVNDAVWASTAKSLGEGPNGSYAIYLSTTRQDSVRGLFQDLLQKTGLGSGSSDDVLKLDVTVRRDRYFIDQSFGRFRIRTEVFLECTFRKGSDVVGRILVCGNAQTHAQYASKKKAEAVYTAAFQDAVFKLLRSKTFLALAGNGWKAGTGEPPESRYDITPIEREKYYGPSDFARGQLKPFQAALAKYQGIPIVLQDLEMKDDKYTDRKESRPDYAAACIPELIQEHINAFYPGAFAAVTRRKTFSAGENLVLAGDLVRFKQGNLALRIWVGMGAGKDKLEANVTIQDGRDQKVLYTYAILESNWGAGWQCIRGQLGDMLDQVGRDLSFLLVSTLAPNYAPPKDLEICFDDMPYPPPASPHTK